MDGGHDDLVQGLSLPMDGLVEMTPPFKGGASPLQNYISPLGKSTPSPLVPSSLSPPQSPPSQRTGSSTRKRLFSGLESDKSAPPSPMPKSRHTEFSMPPPSRTRDAALTVSPNRYLSEFAEEGVLGKGSFGSVFLCKHKLDGCRYAVKRQEMRDSNSRHRAQREVFACATLGQLGVHPNVLRYFSVWRENEYMYIQNEYCDGGSLRLNRTYTEAELNDVLEQVADGLAFIHSFRLVHMDIKPENIFVCHTAQALGDGPRALLRLNSTVTEEKERPPTYKIGDLGLLTSSKVEDDVVEGDSRYMAPELLADNYNNLCAADIFSLGASVYELASGTPLVSTGEPFRNMRNGSAPPLDNFSPEFNFVLRAMLHPNPDSRPTAAVVQSLVRQNVAKAKAASGQAAPLLEADTLRAQLYRERLKNFDLKRAGEANESATRPMRISSLPATSTSAISLPTGSAPLPAAKPTDAAPASSSRRVGAKRAMSFFL